MPKVRAQSWFWCSMLVGFLASSLRTGLWGRWTLSRNVGSLPALAVAWASNATGSKTLRSRIPSSYSTWDPSCFLVKNTRERASGKEQWRQWRSRERCSYTQGWLHICLLRLGRTWRQSLSTLNAAHESWIHMFKQQTTIRKEICALLHKGILYTN